MADDLAEHFNLNYEATDDSNDGDPPWALGETIDTEPAIRCYPAAGIVMLGPEGPVLTIDPMDGGNVALVHLGDVLDWRRGRELAADSTMQRAEADRLRLQARAMADINGVIDAEFAEIAAEQTAAAVSDRDVGRMLNEMDEDPRFGGGEALP